MYSQFGQDEYVLELLGGKRGGYFLDSGASNGVRVSNTLLLESVYGWNGICAEPNTGFFAELVANRRCHCVNCCLYDRDGEVAFVEAAHVLGGILDHYHPRVLNEARSRFGIEVDADGRPPTVMKPTRTVRSVLDQFHAPPVIDYWSLDTEGSELALLAGFPFESYAVRVITIEHNWLPARESIAAFLAERGYDRIAELGADDCYLRRGELEASSWRSNVWRLGRRRRA